MVNYVSVFNVAITFICLFNPFHISFLGNKYLFYVWKKAVDKHLIMVLKIVLALTLVIFIGRILFFRCIQKLDEELLKISSIRTEFGFKTRN